MKHPRSDGNSTVKSVALPLAPGTCISLSGLGDARYIDALHALIETRHEGVR